MLSIAAEVPALYTCIEAHMMRQTASSWHGIITHFVIMHDMHEAITLMHINPSYYTSTYALHDTWPDDKHYQTHTQRKNKV